MSQHSYHKEVNEIRRKTLNTPWPKYIRSVQIAGLRGWSGQEIRFEFPVAVIAGENGTGKSTVLKTLATGYEHPEGDRTQTYFPGTFFPDTPWETVSGVTLSFKVREGTADRSYSIKRPTTRWRIPDRPKRNVLFQDISRTLPVEAAVGYARIAQKTAREVASTQLNSELTRYYSSILGRNYQSARSAASDIDSNRQVGIVQISDREYSQFHQGAGEDATFDLLKLLERTPNTSLILIDEVEASLHPRAQRRLIHFLLWLARTKHVQVILSTHSPFILEELPPEARIFLSRGTSDIDVLYGTSPNYALTRMDDIDCPDLYLFVEDSESRILLTTILRHNQIDMTRIRCMEVGPSNMVEALGQLANQDRLPIKAIGISDGDQLRTETCQKLPGQSAPEVEIFTAIVSSASEALGTRLGLSEASTQNALQQAMSTVDHHEWPSSAARTLRQTTTYLWETMCQVWAQNCLNSEDADLQSLLGKIRNSMS